MRPRSKTTLVLLSLLALILSGLPLATAQDQPPESPRRIALEDLPPQIRLGARVEHLRRQVHHASVLITVPDAPTYLDAIGHWRPNARFPVLIDDGSERAAEDIGRFARAYKPDHIYRYTSPDAESLDGRDATRAAIERTLARIWGAPDGDGQSAVHDRWRELGHNPPGIVAADPNDGAWTAAIALAASHGQPIAWTTRRRHLSAVLQPDEIKQLAEDIESAAEASGFDWRDVGDHIDAVTLCLNVPIKFDGPDPTGEGSVWLATTDRIGRHADDTDGSQRWAWAGQIPGTETTAAYAAMSALFIRPTAVWSFDGYGEGDPWDDYRHDGAIEPLKAHGIEFNAPPAHSGTLHRWRTEASRAIDADLIFVNTRGNRDHFDIQDGRARTGDVPFLNRPAAVYFVHSWSATAPGTRNTIAGRWLERGAYAYVGAVHEPFLQAFVPPENVARMLASSGTWAAAARHNRQHVWKIAVIGDPLLTIGPPLNRIDGRAESIPLEDDRLESVTNEMRAALRAEDFAGAIRALTLLGRDTDARRVAMGLLHDRADDFDTEVAKAALMPVLRAGSESDFIAVFRRLRLRDAVDPIRRDALWLVARRYARTHEPRRVITLLSDHLRDDQFGHDAVEVGRIVAREHGTRSAVNMLQSMRDRAPGDRDKDLIREELRRLGQ